MVHYSCFLNSYTRHYRFLGVLFLFSCIAHQSSPPYSTNKSCFPVPHTNPRLRTVLTSLVFLYYTQFPPPYRKHKSLFPVLHAKSPSVQKTQVTFSCTTRKSPLRTENTSLAFLYHTQIPAPYSIYKYNQAHHHRVRAIA